MNIKPIRNDEDLHAAFKQLELVYQAQEGTSDADEMEILVTLIEAYERKHYPISVSDPVEAIKFRMEQLCKMVSGLDAQCSDIEATCYTADNRLS